MEHADLRGPCLGSNREPLEFGRFFRPLTESSDPDSELRDLTGLSSHSCRPTSRFTSRVNERSGDESLK